MSGNAEKDFSALIRVTYSETKLYRTFLSPSRGPEHQPNNCDCFGMKISGMIPTRSAFKF